MAFLLNRTSLSQFRLQPQRADQSSGITGRGLHVEAGAREKALLAEDPALKPFKSHKKSVSRLKRVGDALTILVVAGCCYEIYVRAVTREETRKQARESA
ncbi:OLC1v1013009C1 [Oldenlandia corymbosa var. corymbosa]|uniref:OLC1v1013009C1 n=1 Tax=Oldenlandia corymbosa var. corymbosa TaxID=529605 RepID=A0AAV1E0R9_OLDCO|nr:OLC1v1013009C1 [Oldenlandia corymbosa var. corymbosa]